MKIPEGVPMTPFSLPTVSGEACCRAVWVYQQAAWQELVLKASTAKMKDENADLYHALQQWLCPNDIPDNFAPIAVGQAVGLYGILYDEQIVSRELAQLDARLEGNPNLTTEHLPKTFQRRRSSLRALFSQWRAGTVPESDTIPQVLPKVPANLLTTSEVVRARDALEQENPHLLDIIRECRLGELVVPEVFPLANATDRTNIARISLFMYDALREAGKTAHQ